LCAVLFSIDLNAKDYHTMCSGSKRIQYYNREYVGARIKRLRKESHLTQNQLSEMLDYTSERQLQRIENGETGCTIDKLMEIAQILNVSTDYLLFGTEYSVVDNKSEGQKRFIKLISDVVLDNLELLVSEI